MKKIGFFAMIAAIGLFASCIKEADRGASVVTESKGSKVLLTVKDEAWTDDGTKTAYYPEKSIVKLTGDEMISLYYPNGESSGKILLYGNIKASPTGAPGQYSFTIPETPSGLTHWYGLLPYSSDVNGFSSKNDAVVLRLGPVQFPGANTFDPHCDFLLAKPFDVTGEPGPGLKSGEISSFKRLFAPLCISVSGLEDGDKIYAATVKFSQEPTASSALAGAFYISFTGDGYSENSISGNANNAGNALSAVYADGLAAVDGRWPVWLMVNPITLTAGSGETLTLSVSTAEKTYTRTVELPKEVSISNEKLSQIKINIKGEGYTVAESVTQDFTEQTLTGTQTLTASDGSSLSWESSITRTFTSSSSDNGSGITSAMYAHQSFTFPIIPGKLITGARIFCHPASRLGGSSSNPNPSSFTVYGSDNYNYNLSTWESDEGMFYKGGAVDIGLPDGCSTLSGVSVAPTNQQNLISAITLFTEDDPAFENDYYAQYEAGRDITINGTVFNKATNGTARLLKLYQMSNANPIVADYTTNGILFLDYDEADNQTDVYTATYHLTPASVVIIGRYRNHQPHLDLATNSKQIGQSGSNLFFKNVKISAGNYYMFHTSNATSGINVSLEDCTLETTNNLMFAESKNGVNFTSIVINNSILKIARPVYGTSNVWASGSTLGIEKLWLTNSVVYDSSGVVYPTIALRTAGSVYWYTPSLDIKVENNSFYNLGADNAGIIALASMAKLNVNNNVGDSSLSKDSAIVFMTSTLDPQISDSSIINNYFNNSSGNCKWSYGYAEVRNSGITYSPNTFTQSASPFTSTNTTTGYFPVNTSVVTNGAGASYATKYWKNWGE